MTDTIYLPRNPAEQASQDYLSRIRYTDIVSVSLFQGGANHLKIMEIEAYREHTVIRVKSMLPKINLINGDYNYFISSIVSRLVEISIRDDVYISDNDIRNMIREKLNQHTDSLFHRLFKSVKSRHPELLYERLITEITTKSHSSEIGNYIDYLNAPSSNKLRALLLGLLELPIFNRYTFTLEEVWGGDNSNSRVILPLRELLFKFIRMGLEDISYNKTCEEYYRVMNEEVKEILDELTKTHPFALESIEYLLFNFLSDKIRHYTLNNYKCVGKEGITYVKMLSYLLTGDDESSFREKVIEDVKVLLTSDEYKYYPPSIEEFYQFFKAFPDQFNIFSNDFLKHILNK